MKPLSQTLLLAGLLLQVSPVEAQPKGADPYAYLTAAAVGKIPPLPETAASEWAVKRGDVVRIRIANVSNLAHPMHLHGHDFVVLAKDGEPLRAPQTLNTVNVAPGETYDIAFVRNNPGAWVFHCHELHHTVNGSTQPGGLIQVIRYDGSASVPAAPKAAPPPAKPSNGAGHGKGH